MYAKQRPIFERKNALNSVITPVVNNNEVLSINSQGFLLVMHNNLDLFLNKNSNSKLPLITCKQTPWLLYNMVQYCIHAITRKI